MRCSVMSMRLFGKIMDMDRQTWVDKGSYVVYTYAFRSYDSAG